MNQVRAEGEPESLARVPTPIFAPEVYATRDLGKPDWARSKNAAQAFLTDVDTAAKAQVQLYEIMGANAQRFDLHAWPLFNASHTPQP